MPEPGAGGGDPRRRRGPHPQRSATSTRCSTRAPAPPRARCSTTTPRSRRCCCRTSKDRAVTRIRWPHGVQDATLLREERARPARRRWVRTAKVPTTGSRGELRRRRHAWSSRSSTTWPRSPGWSTSPRSSCTSTSGRSTSNGQPRNADRLVIDLDPGEPAGLHECCQVALLVRDKLAERGLDAKPGDQRQQGPAPVRRPAAAAAPPRSRTALAKEVAEELQAEHPKLVTATMTKARRSGKVFLDWSQNAGSKTTDLAVLPARAGAPDGRHAASPGTRSRRAPRTRSGSSSSGSRRCWSGWPTRATCSCPVADRPLLLPAVTAVTEA